MSFSLDDLILRKKQSFLKSLKFWIPFSLTLIQNSLENHKVNVTGEIENPNTSSHPMSQIMYVNGSTMNEKIEWVVGRSETRKIGNRKIGSLHTYNYLQSVIVMQPKIAYHHSSIPHIHKFIIVLHSLTHMIMPWNTEQQQTQNSDNSPTTTVTSVKYDSGTYLHTAPFFFSFGA